MPFRVGVRDHIDACNYGEGGGRGIDDCLLGRSDYTKRLPLSQLYPHSGSNLFQPGRTGEFLIVDTNRQQIFHCKDFQFGLVAGVYNATGHRDGPGSQAIFCIGGLQGHFTVTRNSKGEWFIPQRNGKIRKLVIINGQCEVSTFATNAPGSTIACDIDDSLLVSDFYGSSITRISADGKTREVKPTINNILWLYPRKNAIFGLTRYNAYDIVVRFDRATWQMTRVCGLTEAEIAAYKATHGGVYLIDGPALGGATLHSPGVSFFGEEDGELEIQFLGGDVCQFRRYLKSKGRIESLMVSSIWQESQVEIKAPHSNTDDRLPFYAAAGSGRQPNGLPKYTFPVFFKPEPWRKTAAGEVYLYEVAEQPPPQPGGTMDLRYGYLDAVTSDGVAIGWGIDGNKPGVNATIEFWIDGVVAGTYVTDGPCDACLKSYNQWTGNTVNVTPWFRWKLPAKYRDGKTHKIKAFVSGFQLFKPDWVNGKPVPWEITFSLVPEINLPPVMDAGADQEITLPDTASLVGLANDPENQPVAVRWIKLLGPGEVVFSDPTALRTTATFSVPGDYVLQLIGNDGVQDSMGDDVEVIVHPAPVPQPSEWKIVFPKNFFELPKTLKLISPAGEEVIATVEVEP